MDRQLKHLVHLVDDLLDVGRISTGKIDLRRDRVSLRQVLAASAEACRTSIDEHGHELIVEPASEELTVDGDFDRLTQVFSNLLSNAAKYTERGGTIRLRMFPEGGEAVVSVTDTGIGIPAADLSEVFELFSQVRVHQGRAEGGLGIGLSLVRKLLEMHEGSVSVASPGTGRGSTFTVRLPLVATPEAREEPSLRKELPLLRHRVLIVDDNEDAALSLAMLLKQMGHDVDTAFDGHDGVAKAEAMGPDLMFLDLGMPRLDGIAAARQIRALPAGKAITLIALTGWGQERDHQRTREAGFDGHLLKPIEPAELDKLLAAPAVQEPLAVRLRTST